jgi:hypothetical protein
MGFSEERARTKPGTYKAKYEQIGVSDRMLLDGVTARQSSLRSDCVAARFATTVRHA